MKIRYATNPMKIGKHEWRCLVIDANIFGKAKRCTQYQFRRPGGDWKNDSEWPSYDDHDTYNGTPRSLKRLYEKNYPQIRAYLDDMVLL